MGDRSQKAMVGRLILFGLGAALFSASACVERDLPEDAPSTMPPPPAEAASTAPGNLAAQPAEGSFSPSIGGTVVVQPHQTLYSIARQNGVTVRALIEANNLQPPYRVLSGQILHLRRPQIAAEMPRPLAPPNRPVMPPRTAVASSVALATPLPTKTIESLPIRAPDEEVQRTGSLATSSPDSSGHARPAQAVQSAALPPPDAQKTLGSAPPPQAASVRQAAGPVPQQAAAMVPPIAKPPIAKPPSDTRFYWPVRGRIISGFSGSAGATHNDGINIAAPEGTVVSAADGGVVAFVGEKPGFGLLLLIKHDGGWISAYAHNQIALVTKGQRIRRGQPIARVGSSGGVAEPQLHFELRQGIKAVDPQDHMPQLTSSAG